MKSQHKGLFCRGPVKQPLLGGCSLLEIVIVKVRMPAWVL